MLLAISYGLPGGFGYVMNEVQVNVVVDTASDWENVGHIRISQSSVANRNFDYRIPLDFLLFSQNGTTLGVLGTQIPSGLLTRTPIIPRSVGATQQMIFTNLADPASAAGTIDALISYWEYDLEQLAYFPAHSAINTLGR